MKRIVFLTSVIVVTVYLSSCNEGSNELLYPEESKVEEAIEIDYITISEPNANEYQNYSVTGLNSSQVDEKLSYNINYPQIFGLDDINKQIKINEIIEVEALKVLNYYKNSFGSVDVNIDYNVILASNVLSVQYTGLGMVSNAVHPNKLFYTTNIDIKQGERIRLGDIINSDAVAEKFINGNFKALWPEQAEEIEMDEIKIEKLQDNFGEADSLDNIGTEKQSDVYSYFTENSLGISIPVPYAIGGHAEFEIDYSDIKNNIIENDIWNELIKKE
jgi:hypothetical protein